MKDRPRSRSRGHRRFGRSPISRLDFISPSLYGSQATYSGPGGIADDSGTDVSARTTLGLFITEDVSIEEAASKDARAERGRIHTPGPHVQAEQPKTGSEPC